MGSCLYCGFCVEACPQDALYHTQKFENAVYFRSDLDRVLYMLDETKTLKAQTEGSEN